MNEFFRRFNRFSIWFTLLRTFPILKLIHDMNGSNRLPALLCLQLKNPPSMIFHAHIDRNNESQISGYEIINHQLSNIKICDKRSFSMYYIHKQVIVQLTNKTQWRPNLFYCQWLWLIILEGLLQEWINEIIFVQFRDWLCLT